MPRRSVRIMEVCGTHTHNFFKFGLDKLLPGNLRLISGPGCPVCVSCRDYIDTAINLSSAPGTIITTFGDMLKVPGSSSSLEEERAKWGNIQVVYSPLDSLEIARRNPANNVIFLAVGFETTASAIALAIFAAKKEKMNNLSFLTSLKLIPPAITYLAEDRSLNIDGFLCPGHVSSIIGMRPYISIASRYAIPCCVAGFEPLDILKGIHMLIRQIASKKASAQNQYIRAVTKSGNSAAQRIMRECFCVTDASWRGLGVIKRSGLKIRDAFSHFDAAKVCHPLRKASRRPQAASGCKCAQILKGKARPDECALFKKKCTPENPFGPCMVSQEGVCNAYYKYS